MGAAPKVEEVKLQDPKFEYKDDGVIVTGFVPNSFAGFDIHSGVGGVSIGNPRLSMADYHEPIDYDKDTVKTWDSTMNAYRLQPKNPWNHDDVNGNPDPIEELMDVMREKNDQELRDN